MNDQRNQMGVCEEWKNGQRGCIVREEQQAVR